VHGFGVWKEVELLAFHHVLWNSDVYFAGLLLKKNISPANKVQSPVPLFIRR
jgi:hypothetical protein